MLLNRVVGCMYLYIFYIFLVHIYMCTFLLFCILWFHILKLTFLSPEERLCLWAQPVLKRPWRAQLGASLRHANELNPEPHLFSITAAPQKRYRPDHAKVPVSLGTTPLAQSPPNWIQSSQPWTAHPALPSFPLGNPSKGTSQVPCSCFPPPHHNWCSHYGGSSKN